jgi:hypothetical protein
VRLALESVDPRVVTADAGVQQPWNVTFADPRDAAWVQALFLSADCTDVQENLDAGSDAPLIINRPNVVVVYRTGGGPSAESVAPGSDRLGPAFPVRCVTALLRYPQAELARQLARHRATRLISSPVRLLVNASAGWALGGGATDPRALSAGDPARNVKPTELNPAAKGALQRAAQDCALSRAMGREFAAERHPRERPDGILPMPALDPYQPEDPDYRCVGALNRSAAFGEFCARWAMPRNLDGLTDDAARHVRPPSCLARPKDRIGDAAVPAVSRNCKSDRMGAGGDPRMERSGLYELEHWERRDMCGDSQLFRVLHGAQQTDDIPACRRGLARDVSRCLTVDCQLCNPVCTEPWAKTIDGIVNCLSPTTSNAQLYCEESTDQGRYYTKQHNLVPDHVFQEHYRCVLPAPTALAPPRHLVTPRPRPLRSPHTTPMGFTIWSTCTGWQTIQQWFLGALSSTCR